MKSAVRCVCLVSLCVTVLDILELSRVEGSGVTGSLNVTRHRRNSGPTCVLPPHPDNGRWKLVHGDGQPNEEVSISTILQFECNIGYKLTTESPYVICNNNWIPEKLPECEVLCPPILNTTTTISTCTDRNGKPVSCQKATEGTYLSYKCVPFYETPFGYKKSLVCSGGSWNFPKPVCQPVCGKKVTDDAIQLIFGGETKKVIEFPWITALYQKRNNIFENVCGGSIISQRVVLTAAHCVTNDYADVLAKEDYIVAAGKYYNKYRDPRDPKAQYLELSNIVVSPEFKADDRRYIGDLAILVTKGAFTFNELVQPVCFNDVNHIYLQAGNTGVVAGWGVQEGGHPSEELRTLEIPFKYETTCAQELPKGWADRYKIFDKICAGFFNQSMSVCSGDSGSGFYFKNPEDNRYYIHGLVSIAPKDSKGMCDIQQNSLYTKIAFYYEYIDKELSKYQYHVKDCELPDYPDNGRWVIENKDKKPGETVPSNTILRVSCNKGYKLSSEGSLLQCDAQASMPTCQLLCPALRLPHGTDYECKTKEGEKISCGEATQDATLVFSCPTGFVAEGYKHSRQCVNGSWGTPAPGCQRLSDEDESETKAVKTSIQVICVYEMSRISEGLSVPENFNVSLCTHVIFSHIRVWSDGNLRTSDDPFSNNANRSLYYRVTEMKTKNRNLKVLLRVHGEDYNGKTKEAFPTVVADAMKRRKFIESVTSFLDANNFDGLDLDWQVPSNKNIYATLLQEISTVLKQRGWLFTASVYYTPIYIGYDISEMNRVLDWIIVMSYNFALESSTFTGQYSPLYNSSNEREWEKELLNIDVARNTWQSYGIVNKLVLSIAFFGRSFTLKDRDEHAVHSKVDPEGESRVVPYSEICQNYKNWTRVWDNEQKNPYKYFEDKWIGYDDEMSVKEKAMYIAKLKLKAVSVFSIDADDVDGKCGPKQILLKNVHLGLGNNVDLN